LSTCWWRSRPHEPIDVEVSKRRSASIDGVEQDRRFSTFDETLLKSAELAPNSAELCITKKRVGHEGTTLVGRNSKREGTEQDLAGSGRIRLNVSRIRHDGKKCWTRRGGYDSSKILLNVGDDEAEEKEEQKQQKKKGSRRSLDEGEADACTALHFRHRQGGELVR
jgi:hypothetical protein